MRFSGEGQLIPAERLDFILKVTEKPLKDL